jgi:hypothetical protein
MNFTDRSFQEAGSGSGGSQVTDRQLELGFAGVAVRAAAGPRSRRLSRANWWFQRMRQLVDRATDWQPALPVRPQQIWLPNTHRAVSVAPEVQPSERQICE